jgi:hypothetical protein
MTIQAHRKMSLDTMTSGMLELQAILKDLDMQECFNDLVENGFDTWDNLTGIKETDMATFGMKLGHRRKLQREIDRRQGHDDHAASSGVHAALPQTNEGGSSVDGKIQEPHAKRRYRRRIPRDPNAPTRPDTAYVTYSKAQRQDPEVAKLPFIEIAKPVGDRWTHVSKNTKNLWNQIAKAERDQYKSAVADYRQTESYRQHRDMIQSMFPRKEACENGVTCDVTLPQSQPSEPESDLRSSTTEGGESKIFMDYLTDARKIGSEHTQGSSTAPVC